MKDGSKLIMGLLMVAIVAMVIGWVVTINDYGMQKVFSPRIEQVRHDTFKHSQAYVDGKISDIEHMRTLYETADTVQTRHALRAEILLDFDELPEGTPLPPGLRSFVADLESKEVR